ncbi:DNA-processing protein DprA [Nonomuraea sp. NPDC050556]|uniref:DNA-processing protein DprA n=1 Tax=Nonomuraea sp. NPDC050556 TaxID=3364369 RepID=UPI0037B916E0
MSAPQEQAAVLALTMHADGAWPSIARIIQDSGSALRLIVGDIADVDYEDRAYALAVIASVRPSDLTWAASLIASAHTHDVRLITVLDSDYPGNLDFAHDLQPFLWARGRLRTDDWRALTIVGDDSTALADAHHVAQAAARAGLTVVAGLRTQVDLAVHEAALAVGSRSLAVLDQGIHTPLNAEPYAAMATELTRRGVLVSQFWPHTPSDEHTVASARVVTSGLAAALYVADGTHDSGPAHQARIALDHGRHVFVPHRLYREQAWVRSLAYRGGVTAVHTLDELIAAVVDLMSVGHHPAPF